MKKYYLTAEEFDELKQKVHVLMDYIQNLEKKQNSENNKIKRVRGGLIPDFPQKPLQDDKNQIKKNPALGLEAIFETTNNLLKSKSKTKCKPSIIYKNNARRK